MEKVDEDRNDGLLEGLFHVCFNRDRLGEPDPDIKSANSDAVEDFTPWYNQ